MNLLEVLPSIRRLFIDTAPVIYFVEQNSQYLAVVRPVFEAISDHTIAAIVSPVTLAECLVRPCELQQTQYQNIFINLLTNSAGIKCIPISQNLALEAARLRIKYNLQLPDAFQVAVALATSCDTFLTNDFIFKRVTELRILIVNDLDSST